MKGIFRSIFDPVVNLAYGVAGILGIANGGTGASTAAGARTALSVYSQAEVDALLSGLLDFRGNFDASGGGYPTTNGSGTAGAILKGDAYRISVAGAVGDVNDVVFALVDTPGQTAGNWDVVDGNLTSATFGTFLNGLTSKATPVDADLIPLGDSAASNVAKKLTWANLKATLKTYFDTLYATGTPIKTVTKQIFAASGTYTPTTGMVFCVIEAWGGGGAGGGVAGSLGQTGGAGGGGAGAYSKHRATAAEIGASQTVTIGAAGAAGTTGNNAGGNGGTTSLGALCTAPGGSGGGGAPGNGGGAGGAGGTAGTANLVAGVGANGFTGMGSPNVTGMYALGGQGASCGSIGGGGVPAQTAGTQAGSAATGKASGGSGGAVQNSTGTVVGGVGTIGYMVITEYLSV